MFRRSVWGQLHSGEGNIDKIVQGVLSRYATGSNFARQHGPPRGRASYPVTDYDTFTLFAKKKPNAITSTTLPYLKCPIDGALCRPIIGSSNVIFERGDNHRWSEGTSNAATTRRQHSRAFLPVARRLVPPPPLWSSTLSSPFRCSYLPRN